MISTISFEIIFHGFEKRDLVLYPTSKAINLALRCVAESPVQSSDIVYLSLCLEVPENLDTLASNVLLRILLGFQISF